MEMKKTKKKAIMIARKQTTNKIMFYRKETTMKKVIQILLICLIIAGTIVTATVGFNVGLKYSEHDEISINVGSKFNVADIKATAKIPIIRPLTTSNAVIKLPIKVMIRKITEVNPNTAPVAAREVPPIFTEVPLRYLGLTGTGQF